MVDWHVDCGIVAVACVGRDMIKVWPLPVEQPWGKMAMKTTMSSGEGWVTSSITFPTHPRRGLGQRIYISRYPKKDK